MTDKHDPSRQNKTARIILPNKLKQRLGPNYRDDSDGYLSADAIKKADQLISDLCLDCPSALGTILDRLVASWQSLLASPSASSERGDLLGEMFTHAHEMKDVGAQCGYELISYFAESLRDYIAHAELDIEAKLTIIQAHLDALQIVQRHGIKQDQGPQAEELKRTVKLAVQKYS